MQTANKFWSEEKLQVAQLCEDKNTRLFYDNLQETYFVVQKYKNGSVLHTKDTQLFKGTIAQAREFVKGLPEPAKYMDKCLADLDFSTNEEYYEYCVESHINEQFSQCRELFNAMPKDNQHALIGYIDTAHANDTIHNFFVNLF